MIRLTRIELLEMRTIRAPFGLLAAVIFAVAGPALLALGAPWRSQHAGTSQRYEPSSLPSLLGPQRLPAIGRYWRGTVVSLP